ncbi:TetR/AcrR family transcriptional regulator [Luminiphilus sp.]|nr:TetR/AcrR family transcriptional regulator [Luminiphilus sp.]MDA9625484.1 TetR/AcrR family transcriptional regulator [Luminiphilus sp.]MDA9625492.1 TetR/AcrR family transcriptional regulator [Luminiphilus sp.]
MASQRISGKLPGKVARKSTKTRSAQRDARKTSIGAGWQAEKSALTRQAILEAAVRCFVQHGYTNTTTAMIAEEGDVSRGAMMHHFSSRSAVMEAVVGYLHVRRLNEYRQLMSDIDSPDQMLTRAAIRTSVETAWKYVNLPSFIAYQELLGAARTDPALASAVDEVERDFEREFLKTVRAVFPHWKQVKSLKAAHELVQFVMQGMGVAHRSPQREQRARRVIDTVTDYLETIYLADTAS